MEKVERKYTDGKNKKELAELVQKTIDHLNGLSNKKMTVQVPGHVKNFSVEELIWEVGNKTDTGLEYINQFHETIEVIGNIKKLDEVKKEKRNWTIPIILIIVFWIAFFIFFMWGIGGGMD